MKSLDDIDVKILQMLRKNARIPLKDLSAEVFLTTPAVSSRIEKLEAGGYIRGYHADCDFEKMGYGISVYILITVKPEDRNEFYAFIRKHKNVIECNQITGPYSMIVKAVFPSTSNMKAFVGELQRFGKTDTQVVFDTICHNF